MHDERAAGQGSTAGTYDAIVVGARVAGAPTAMLLARKGYRVLLVDRGAFPSDTMSTYLIHAPGMELLQKWGRPVAWSRVRPIAPSRGQKRGFPVAASLAVALAAIAALASTTRAPFFWD